MTESPHAEASSRKDEDFFDFISPFSVPEAILAFPASDQRRFLERGLAAQVIDGYLLRLGAQQAPLRRLFGRLARIFVERRLYQRLGFRSLGDFSRERLGVSASEVRSAARLERGLGRLPRLAQAFERGELSFSQARLLATVCTPENESRWVERARCLTVRGLLSEIERLEEKDQPDGPQELGEETGAHGGSSARERAEALEEVRERVEGEVAVRFSVQCPRRLLPLWREALERARWLSGSDGPLWQAAEAIAAEGASSLGPEPMPGLGEASPETPDVVSFEGKDHGESETAEEPALRSEAFPDVDWGAIVEAAPVELDRFFCGLEGLGLLGLEGRFRKLMWALRRLDWQTGRLLHILFRLRLHRLLGFRSREQYVRERLGMSARKARSLVRLDRKGFDHPELASAREKGRLSSLRALALLPVLDERNTSAWVERAREVTLRRLLDEVDWALDRYERSGARGFLPLPPPYGEKLGEEGARERCGGTGEGAHPRPDGEAGSRPAEGEDGAFSAAEAKRQMCAPGGCDARIAFVGPSSVVSLFRAVVAAYTPPGEPRWRGLERLCREVLAHWNSLPHHPDPVFRRDRYRCTVPACSARANLHDHHLLFRSHGGDNSLANRTPVCAWHHLRGLHRGSVRAAGRAPNGILWQLGTARLYGFNALCTLLGERYLEGFPD